MKQIIRTLVLFVMLACTLPDASAQVSVRRTGSRTSESSQSSSRKKDKDKKKDKADKDSKSPADSRRIERPERRGANEGDSRAVVSPEDSRNNVQGKTSVGKKPVEVGDNAATPTRRVQPKKETTPVLVDGNSQRQQSFAEYQRREEGYTPWQHVVYRELDLTNEKNASLYYPQEPQDGLTNLFRVILEGLCNGRLKGYEYLDGREVFSAKYEVKVQDVLDKFQILYQTRPGVGQGNTVSYFVDEMDVPCNEVLSYFIKERWEFNQKTSKYGPRILALCPVLHRAGDFGGDAVHYPMFWVNYEDLRPLLRDHLVMSDGMNNTPRFTMEEFFTLEQYQGDIYKVQNTRGLSLMQQYPDADTLKIMRAKIERQLRGFGDSIWIHEPTEAELAAQDSVRAAERAERRSKRSSASGKADRPARAEGTRQNRRTKEVVDMDAVADAEEAKADEIDRRVEQTGTAHSAKRSARRSR